MAELRDSFQRLHDNLRVSVTDRCNIRCYYCIFIHFNARYLDGGRFDLNH